MLNIDSILHLGGAWFLQSGIQEKDGGVARYYRSDLARNARTSTEITGYAVSALLYLAERTGDANYTEAAVRGANFLTDKAWLTALRAFPYEHSSNCDQPKPLTFFFDCGIIVRGLLEAWRATGTPRFLDVAVEAGRSMIVDFQTTSTIHPILHLPGKEPLPNEPKWSASPGCYQLKSAAAWHDLAAITGDHRFKAAYESALEAALRNEPSFLPGSPDRERTMDRLHAYCYFLEGILPAANQPECVAAINAGIGKTAAYLEEIEPLFARSDVYAQLLRVRLFASQLANIPLDETRAKVEAERAAEFQIVDQETPTVNGGFLFGRKAGVMLPFINPVSTAFCLQALALWDDYRGGNLTARWHELI